MMSTDRENEAVMLPSDGVPHEWPPFDRGSRL
jgi:hypothetical protein